MRKLLQWVLPAFIGIAPALGMNESDDDFLLKKDCIYSPSGVYENDNKIMLMVDRTSEDAQTASRDVEAKFSQKRWVDFVEGRFSKAEGTAFAFAWDVNGKAKIERPYTKDMEYPFTPIKESEIRYIQGIPMKEDDDLPIGVLVDVCKATEYEAKSGKTYFEKGEMLYQLLKDKKTEAKPMFAHTERTFTKNLRQQRQDIQLYLHELVTLTTYKIPFSNMDDKIVLSEKIENHFSKYRNGHLIDYPYPANDYPTAQAVFPPYTVHTGIIIG